MRVERVNMRSRRRPMKYSDHLNQRLKPHFSLKLYCNNCLPISGTVYDDLRNWRVINII